MKSSNSILSAFRFARKFLFLGAIAMLHESSVAQETQIEPVVIPEDQIQQGRNKGVETWEGTLFGQDSYKPGSYAQIEVVPNPGFEFEKWEGENIADAMEAKTFVQMDEHVSIKPHYKRIWNVIAAPDNKEAGEVKGSGNYPEGSEVTLTVEPNEGFKFLGWEGKGIDEATKEELQTQITVEGDHDIVARFEQDGDGDGDGDGGGGGGGGGGGDSDQNEDENQDQEDQQNQNESEPNEEPSDEEEQPQEPQDQNGDEELPQEPEPGEDEPAEPEDGDEQGNEGEEQSQEPGGEDEAPVGEGPEGGQPIPMQMTPEEAVRLLEAMEDGEKKLPLFIVQPPDKKDSKKDW